MNVVQRIDGSVLQSVREYDIAATTDVKKGQIVVLSEGLVTAANAAQTGKILGIAAESHSGSADALNTRSNGTKIRVYDDPMLVMACAAPVVEASGGSATTVTATTLAAFSADDFNGGYLMLIEKASGSTNTDAIGTVKRITDYAYTSTGTVSTFTVASGATAVSGDKYAVFPPIGFAKGNLSAGIDALVLTATAALPLKVVGRMERSREILLMPKLHSFGIEA